MGHKGRILYKVKEPRPNVIVCADLTCLLRARIEGWFKDLLIWKRKNKKGGKLRKYLHHIIIEEFAFYIDDDIPSILFLIIVRTFIIVWKAIFGCACWFVVPVMYTSISGT